MSSTQNRPLKVSGYLVVRANGELRTTKTKVALRIDEVAFPLTVVIPHTWGRVQSTSIDVALPEPPEAIVTIEEPETVDYDENEASDDE